MSTRFVMVAACLWVGAACNKPPPPDPTPTTTTTQATPAAPATAGSGAPTPTAVVTKPAAPTDDKKPADTWLLVRKDGIELGIIELRKGKAPKLALSVKSEEGAALQKTLDQIGGPDGIGLDMHLPPPSGEGRGPYGTQIVTWDSELYRHALEQRLEPTYDVKEVPFLPTAMPPEQFERIEVSRSGKKVGSIDFSSKPPKLTKDGGDSADVMGLENNFERITSAEGLRVRFHYDKGGTQTLMDVTAKPGDPNHAQVAALYLIVERFYQPRYAYDVQFVK